MRETSHMQHLAEALLFSNTRQQSSFSVHANFISNAASWLLLILTFILWNPRRILYTNILGTWIRLYGFRYPSLWLRLQKHVEHCLAKIAVLRCFYFRENLALQRLTVSHVFLHSLTNELGGFSSPYLTPYL